jgi:hypothetical protein
VPRSDRVYPGLAKARRKQTRQDRRQDQPPRGVRLAWTAALRHGSSLPEDHVVLWACALGHRLFTVGPHVWYRGHVLVSNGGYQPCVIKCLCHRSPVQQLVLHRDMQQAARAVYRLSGEAGLQDLLASQPHDPLSGHGHHVGLPMILGAPRERSWSWWPQTFPRSPMITNHAARR